MQHASKHILHCHGNELNTVRNGWLTHCYGTLWQVPYSPHTHIQVFILLRGLTKRHIRYIFRGPEVIARKNVLTRLVQGTKMCPKWGLTNTQTHEHLPVYTKHYMLLGY